MPDKQVAEPENTAVRVALWRALHLRVDAPPHVFVDEVGLRLVAPEDGWQRRPDMGPFTRPFRASIVARTLRRGRRRKGSRWLETKNCCWRRRECSPMNRVGMEEHE